MTMDPFIKGIEAATANASPEIRAAVERFKTASADANKEAIEASSTSEGVSCSIGGKPVSIRFSPPGFDPYHDKDITVGALKHELARIEAQIGLAKPQTDRVMDDLARKKSFLEQAITNFLPSESFPSRTREAKKRKRQSKRHSRKTARLD